MSIKEDPQQTYIFEIINIPKIFEKEKLEKHLQDNGIKYIKIKQYDLDPDFINYQIITKTPVNPDIIQKLTSQPVNCLKIQAFPINMYDGSLSFPSPKPGEKIEYDIDYHKLIMTEYAKQIGDNFIVYTNTEFLEKQRNLFSYFVQKIGSNILQGKSIMNISLPIFIFDKRTLLELWVWQNAYCDEYLTKASNANNPIERLKLTTTFALTKLHLTVSQQKPFNPILGETFQCKIGDSMIYLEQTSHHPPRSHFYVIGKNYKLYGYNEPEASASPNSISVCSKGKLFVEFPDGDKHEIYYPPMVLGGTVMGDRTIDFTGTLEVIDEKNDLFSYVLINPDERGMFEKMIKKKNKFPDYIKGYITSISKNGRFSYENQIYTIINCDKDISGKIEGELTQYLNFDDISYWNYDLNTFPSLYRQNYILKSDSFFREDLYFLIKKNEDLAGRYKHVLEERQRKDRRLRNNEQ